MLNSTVITVIFSILDRFKYICYQKKSPAVIAHYQAIVLPREKLSVNYDFVNCVFLTINNFKYIHA